MSHPIATANRTVRPNRKTPPRVLVASTDPRVEAIELAARACLPTDIRDNWLYGRTVLPRAYVAFLDEQRLAAAASKRSLAEVDEAIVAMGRAMYEAALTTVRDLRAKVSVPDALAVEAVVDGESARNVAKLLSDPNDPFLLRQVRAGLELEVIHAERALEVVDTKLQQHESQRSA